MASAAVEISGVCVSGFEPVQEAFAENFEHHGDVGASVAISVGGDLVVDLWGGYADAARTQPWQRDTVATTYSTTKGMVALCAHMLADRGELDWDAPVSSYWPEFGQHGKDHILVRELMTHTAGLPAIHEPLPTEAIFDWQRMTSVLADETVWPEVAGTFSYHSVTYGFLVGEVIRRISGRSLGTFFREEVAEPLDAAFYIGFGPELDDRVAEMIPADVDPLAAVLRDEPESLRARVMHNPPAHNSDRSIPNSRAWRAAEIPSVNGHGNARALARIYGALATGGEAHGVRLLSPEAALSAGTIEVSSEAPAGSGQIMAFGLGFSAVRPSLPEASERAYGHSGQGGSLGFVDPQRGFGFGYVPNQTQYVGDERRTRLATAVYECV